MTDVRKLHKARMKNPAYKETYEQMGEEFSIASALIAARKSAGLTQKQLAERMDASQSSIARLESGAVNTTIETLQRVAGATGKKLQISFA